MNPLSFLSFFRNKLSLITSIAGMIITFSCAEDDLQPLFTNSVIKGHVRFNYPDQPPVNIGISTHGPYQKKSALTDSSGYYEISGLGNGTYELEFFKEGYGIKYDYGIQLFGNDTIIRNEELYERVKGWSKLPEFHEIHDRITYPWVREGCIVITTNWSVDKMPEGSTPIRVFLDDHENVSFMNYKCTRRGNFLRRRGFDYLLLKVDDLPFKYGQEIFLITYVCNPEDEGYLNSYLGVWIFSTLENDKHSPVMYFTMH